MKRAHFLRMRPRVAFRPALWHISNLSDGSSLQCCILKLCSTVANVWALAIDEHWVQLLDKNISSWEASRASVVYTRHYSLPCHCPSLTRPSAGLTFNYEVEVHCFSVIRWLVDRCRPQFWETAPEQSRNNWSHGICYCQTLKVVTGKNGSSQCAS